MSFFAELKRRNVIRVGIAYIVVAWVVAQVAEFAFENFGAPDWVLKSVVVMLILGLPLVLIFAWAFELTPEGIKLEKEVDREQSITSQTGRKLDRTIIVVLLVALGWFAWDKFGHVPEPAPATAAVEEAVDEPAESEPQRADKSVAVLPFAVNGCEKIHEDLDVSPGQATGGARTVHRDIAAADDPEARRTELIAEYEARFNNPYLAAEHGLVDEVIEPR